jgi:hypothetical protein
MSRLVYGHPTFYSGYFFQISKKNVGITQTPTSKWFGLLGQWLTWSRLNMEWPKKSLENIKKKGKVDFNIKHGFQVFIWALKVAMRLVNTWQTL